MSIPEATQLVLQAAALAENGALYILDMGEPVKIIDLACELIQLSGLEPGVDIEIQFTGLRPGEKLYEELLTVDEGVIATRYEQILAVHKNSVPHKHLDAMLAELFDAAREIDGERIKHLLQQMVPSYQPNNEGPH